MPKQSTTIVILTTLADTNVLRQNINVDFIPDRVCVRNIMFEHDDGGDDPGFVKITTNMISTLDSSIGVIASIFGYANDVCFNVDKSISGTQEIRFSKAISGVFAMTLEFIKD